MRAMDAPSPFFETHTLMDSSLDVLCACAMLIVVVAVTATYGVTS